MNKNDEQVTTYGENEGKEKDYKIRRMEELGMNAWPALETRLYDGWILRFANGYTKRANSVNPVYHSWLPLQDKIRFCERQYHARGLPVIFKLTGESHPQEIDDELENKGYARLDETAVRVLEMKQYNVMKAEDIIIASSFTGAWFRGFLDCSGLNNAHQLTAQGILNSIRGETIWVCKKADGKIVGCGFGVIEREYMGIYDIVVAEDYRGNGYGRDIMNGILGTGKKKGTITAYLSVFVGNTPAERLYNRLGFREIYRYWYRKTE